MSWKTFFFDETSESNEQLNDDYGFKSAKTPPKNEHLNVFQNNMYSMVRNSKFKNGSHHSSNSSKMM